jgi:hypothetical protein
VDPHDERGALDGFEVARQVEQVFAPRRRRRDIDETVQARLAVDRKPPGRRRRGPPQQPARQRGDFFL